MNTNLMTMALQLSMQDSLSNSWFSSALMNKAWTDMLSSSVNGLLRKTSGQNMLGAALGGRLRGDAAMLRQASANVSEAQSMMSMAATAAGNIAGQIKEAQKLAEAYLALPATIPQDDPARTAILKQYQAISDNIDSIIKNTTYNGMSLLNGGAWLNGDERLTVTQVGSGTPLAASVHIQAGESGFPLTFSDMSADFNNIARIAEFASPDAVRDELSKLQKSAQNLADMYAGRAGSLQSQAASLKSQATILTEAAAQRAKTSAPVSTENLLLNLILRDSGSIFSGQG
jgi:flagellin